MHSNCIALRYAGIKNTDTISWIVWKIPINLAVRRKMNSSLKHIVLQLEDLTRQDISIDVGLDMLESSAKTLKDVITINVMRDSYNELLMEERQCQTP